MTIQEALERSADELQQQIEKHRRMLSQAWNGEGRGEVDPPSGPGDSESRKIRQTLVETIEVLEATRRSFKSKQLEQLRRRLVRVLAELT